MVAGHARVRDGQRLSRFVDAATTPDAAGGVVADRRVRDVENSAAGDAAASVGSRVLRHQRVHEVHGRETEEVADPAAIVRQTVRDREIAHRQRWRGQGDDREDGPGRVPVERRPRRSALDRHRVRHVPVATTGQRPETVTVPPLSINPCNAGPSVAATPVHVYEPPANAEPAPNAATPAPATRARTTSCTTHRPDTPVNLGLLTSTLLQSLLRPVPARRKYRQNRRREANRPPARSHAAARARISW
jgi:hypothetical protein